MHEMKPHWKLGRFYSGFTQAWLRESPRMLSSLSSHLRNMVAKVAGRWNTVRGWQVFLVDGTRIEAPHTMANEQVLLCAGREKTGPQISLTTLLHLGTGLPWDFRLGPGTESERVHLHQMLDSLPLGSLLIADAGFFGYETARKLDESERFFLLRVGGNKTLLTDDDHPATGEIYSWPLANRDQPPLSLRLITLTEGKETIYLVTNVFDKNKLSDGDASLLYRWRWQQEVYHRSYKRTMDRHRVLSRNGQTSLAEVTWTMLGLWMLGLMAVKRQVSAGRRPMRWSMAKTRDAVRRVMRHPRRRQRSKNTFDRDLINAVGDDYKRRRTKQARKTFPRKKREKPPGPPKFKTLSPEERLAIKQLTAKHPTAA